MTIRQMVALFGIYIEDNEKNEVPADMRTLLLNNAQNTFVDKCWATNKHLLQRVRRLISVAQGPWGRIQINRLSSYVTAGTPLEIYGGYKGIFALKKVPEDDGTANDSDAEITWTQTNSPFLNRISDNEIQRLRNDCQHKFQTIDPAYSVNGITLTVYPPVPDTPNGEIVAGTDYFAVDGSVHQTPSGTINYAGTDYDLAGDFFTGLADATEMTTDSFLATDEIFVSGDHTANVNDGEIITVSGTTSNNGDFKVLSSSFGAGLTKFTVDATYKAVVNEVTTAGAVNTNRDSYYEFSGSEPHVIEKTMYWLAYYARPTEMSVDLNDSNNDVDCIFDEQYHEIIVGLACANYQHKVAAQQAYNNALEMISNFKMNYEQTSSIDMAKDWLAPETGDGLDAFADVTLKGYEA